MAGGLPTPGGSDVWGAQLNQAIKAIAPGADFPPSSANAKDDEFDGTTSVTWTATPTAPTTWNVAGGHAYIRSNGNGTPFPLVGRYQSIPGAYPFTIETKVSSANLHTTSAFVGLLISTASPTASSASMTLSTGVAASAGATGVFTQRIKWTAFTGSSFSSAATENAYSPTVGSTKLQPPAVPRYLRMIGTSASSWACYTSMDGSNWRTLETGVNPGFTPGVMGIIVCENGQTDLEATFEYFRVS